MIPAPFGGAAARPSAPFAILIAVGLGLAGGGAASAEGWTVRLGPQVGVAPPYEGADRDVLQPALVVDVRPRGAPDRFVPPDGGTTVAILSNRFIELGPLVRFREERKPTGELTGLRKVNWSAEPGAYVDLWPTSWLRGRVEGRYGVGGYQGWVGDAAMDLVFTGARRGSRWDASVGPRIGWGDQRYMRTYFGVTAAEAARSPSINEAYSPGGGRRYTGFETAVAYNFNRRWRVTADFGYQRLAHSAAASPIVRLAGSQDQYLSSLGVTYTFGQGP